MKRLIKKMLKILKFFNKRSIPFSQFGKGIGQEIIAQCDQRFSKIYKEAEKHGNAAVPLIQIELDAVKAQTQALVQSYQVELKAQLQTLEDEENRLIQQLNQPLDLESEAGFFITEAGSLKEIWKNSRAVKKLEKPLKKKGGDYEYSED